MDKKIKASGTSNHFPLPFYHLLHQFVHKPKVGSDMKEVRPSKI